MLNWFELLQRFYCTKQLSLNFVKCADKIVTQIACNHVTFYYKQWCGYKHISIPILEFSFGERDKVKPCTVKYTQRSSINFQELKLSTNRGGSKRVAKFLSESNTFHIRSKVIKRAFLKNFFYPSSSASVFARNYKWLFKGNSPALVSFRVRQNIN